MSNKKQLVITGSHVARAVSYLAIAVSIALLVLNLVNHRPLVDKSSMLVMLLALSSICLTSRCRK